jgi:5'-nucleotidase
VQAQQDESSSPRALAPLTVLQINDVYSTLPIDGLGGLARVATLKRNIAAAGRTPLLVLAGDFLSPSVASGTFKGAQMIAALNAAGLDFATLGNHEFDFGVDVLIERMREAQWQWVVSNVIDTDTGQPIGGAAPYVIRTFGTMKVGFIGLCLTTGEINRDRLTHARIIDPEEAAALYLPILEREGVNVIVAITHLAFSDDRALAQKFPQIDIIGTWPTPSRHLKTAAHRRRASSWHASTSTISLALERFFRCTVTSALARRPERPPS